jgi:multidrug efflux system outer membrane protein
MKVLGMGLRYRAPHWLCLGALAGCGAGSDYHPPVMPVPARFAADSSAPRTAQVVSPAPPIDAWWTSFGDEQLSKLADRAVAQNLDLRVAQERVQQARAERRIAAADFYPQLNVSAKYSRARSSVNGYTVGGSMTNSMAGSMDANGGMSSSMSMSGGLSTTAYNLWQLGLDANWEVDLFGRVRRNVEAADADVAAQAESRNGVLLSVTSDLVRAYVELRGAQRALQIARENLEAQQRSVAIARTRYSAGLTTELDVAQAESQAADTAANIPQLESMVREHMHELAILLGEQPSALSAELQEAKPIPQGPELVPVGVPADILRRRPDIRQAERLLAAASARGGSARAELWPRLTLTGSGGLLARQVDQFVANDSLYYAVGPTLSWPIFDGGRIRARVDEQDAIARQARATYASVVLSALRDVQNALVELGNERVRHDSLDASLEASARALKISNELYTQGLTTFLNVIEAQRAFFSAQSQLASSDQQGAIDLVQLYRALGGGWQTRTK